VVANLLSLAVLILAFHNMMDVVVMPQLAHWFLIAGVVLAIPAVLYQQRSLRLARELVPGQTENARQLQQLNRLVVGCALAELPGLMATVYYLFSRDWIATGVLLLATVVLLLRARPQ
jgi:Ca2+/Na+ antiporter